MNKDEALCMAIEAMENEDELSAIKYGIRCIKAIQACKDALEQPKQEPVAWMETYKGEPNNVEFTRAKLDGWSDNKKVVPLYTHPKEWQGLSDYEISELWYKSQNDVEGVNLGFTTQEHFFAGMIEAKLREKNDA
jgi:hypothetical protein